MNYCCWFPRVSDRKGLQTILRMSMFHCPESECCPVQCRCLFRLHRPMPHQKTSFAGLLFQYDSVHLFRHSKTLSNRLLRRSMRFPLDGKYKSGQYRPDSFRPRWYSPDRPPCHRHRFFHPVHPNISHPAFDILPQKIPCRKAVFLISRAGCPRRQMLEQVHTSPLL